MKFLECSMDLQLLEKIEKTMAKEAKKINAGKNKIDITKIVIRVADTIINSYKLQLDYQKNFRKK